MANVLSGWAAPRSYDWDPRAAMRAQYGAYLSSPEWKAKRDWAFVIWRGIGWTATAGPVAAHQWFAPDLHGLATLVLTPVVQVLAAFGLAYALTIRLAAVARHQRLHREGGHLFGYQNRLYHEHWWDITPQSRGVNWGEKFLRRFLPGPKAHRYLTRTLIAVALCRFWWVGVGFGLAWWHWGLANTLGWLQMVGHRI